MAVYFYTEAPQALLDAFKAAIDEGDVQTWLYDQDNDLTHNVPQWKNKAWFRPRINDDALVFNIVSNKTVPLTTEVYAVYHGRIAESFLAHFDSQFDTISMSSFPEPKDII